MPYPPKEKDDSKSKTLHPSNISMTTLIFDINDSHFVIPIANTINIEYCDLQFNFVIQSCNGSNQK